MSPVNRRFHIHGDNIVECGRTLELIQRSLADAIASVDGPLAPPACPSYRLRMRGRAGLDEIVLLPGFGRWNEDILGLVRARGGALREAADAIVSAVADKEEPLLAIEYCGALPAGNQAWQRNGRAYSFGLGRIPYIYMAEIGGYELSAARGRLAERLPNPAVPFSYVCYSLWRGSPVAPVFVPSPGASKELRAAYADIFGGVELQSLVRAIITDQDVGDAFVPLSERTMAFVRLRASVSAPGSTLTPDQWSDAYSAVRSKETLVNYLLRAARLPWAKTAYIDALTESARQLMNVAADHAVGLTSTKLPMCIIPPPERAEFAAKVERIYRVLPHEFVAWLHRKSPLVVCWVMGFKPRGDDARPDRGLAPLARMLIGEREDLLTVVYGPAPAATWPLLARDPAELVRRNGLWEAVLDVSGALLVDSSTDTVTHHGFLQQHWLRDIPSPTSPSLLVVPAPIRMGEQDVDTVLHGILSSLGRSQVFEGMCNPPGGDWSGISLQMCDRTRELRWLSLPRVSASSAKRPDHVFQVFGIGGRPVVLAVESKDRASMLEEGVGPRLTRYITDLLTSEASVERIGAGHEWEHSTTRLAPEQFAFASAVAFVAQSTISADEVHTRTAADLVFAFAFGEGGRSCEIRLTHRTDIGRRTAEFLRALPTTSYGVFIHQD